MLPFDEDEEGPDNRPTPWNYDDDVFGSISQAQGVFDVLMDNWVPNEGGFDAQTIYDSIYEIDNYEEWEDEEGNMHYEFDYYWEHDGYSGHGHYSG